MEAPIQLLAQMHNELRTPLNAMIGFSEVMLRELHGPLGHARYQEYAAHISESGGRLLKASEDALAVAATMSALVGDRRALRRERLSAGELVREAWAAAGAPGWHVQLTIDDAGAAEIECDRQATSEALQHLLGEAAARTPRGGVMVARGGRSGVEIVAVAPVASTEQGAGTPAADPGQPAGHSEGGDGLRLVLARSLIEMQGATLTIDNTGSFGSIMSQPIVPVGQVAIITTEAIRREFRPTGDDGFGARSVMNLCVSFDHRALDGADVGAFMRDVRLRLEAYRGDQPIA